MRRDDILKAAARIFRKKGFHATSMRDIAAAVDLRKASLYHHIASKQEILLALLDQAMNLLIDDLEQVVETELAPEAKLARAVHCYVGRLAGDVDLAAVLLLEYRCLEPELLRRHVERRDRFEGLWRSILREGAETGAFRGIDPDVAGFALLGVQNWMITWYQPGGRLNPEQLADRFTKLFLRGIAADGRRPHT